MVEVIDKPTAQRAAKNPRGNFFPRIRLRSRATPDGEEAEAAERDGFDGDESATR